MIYCFDTLASTNTEAMEKRYVEWDVITARHQTAGRGQQSHVWESAAGRNLTFSVVLIPQQMEARDQFRLSQMTALALVDTLEEFGIGAKIKWTNDIYVAGRKICGVLIENELYYERIVRSIIGIGLNINQTVFDPSLPNPTSMALVKGRTFNLNTVLNTTINRLQARRNLPPIKIQSDYQSHLYMLDTPRRYRFSDGEAEGIIRGVDPTGELIMEVNGEVRKLLYGEVQWIL